MKVVLIKGFTKVPLNALFGRDTRNSYQSRLRTIQRDGGARLEGSRVSCGIV